MIIELTGVPCAGKSTLTKYIQDELSSQYGHIIFSDVFIDSLSLSKYKHIVKMLGKLSTDEKALKIVRKIVIFTHIFYSLRKFHNVHFLATKLIIKNRQSLKAVKSYFSKFGKYFAIKCNIKDECVLVREGVVHTVQSIFVSNKREKKQINKSDLERFLESIPLPEVIVIVYFRNKKELVQRILKRGHHRLRNVPLFLRERFVENAIVVEDMTLCVLGKKKGTNIILRFPVKEIS